MPTYLLLGLLSWLLLGAVAGALAARLLPGRPPLPTGAAIGLGMAGALFGGMAATVLGFGGLAVYDPRSLATATFVSLLALTWWRIAKLAA
ncbi:MAG: hypothetical protein MI919_03305 [Holophagales bacterium]|nr:hypothetical protein [Holophagales bacterium]